VSDMNYVGYNKVTQRTISSTLAVGYIHTRPPAIDKKPEIKKTKTIHTISIQISQWTTPQTSIWWVLGQNTILSVRAPSETIIYAANSPSTSPENDTENNTKETSTVADTRYIMQHIAARRSSIDIV
jgi:hypothetical protein